MAIERKFIAEALKKLQVDRYIHNEMNRVGVGNVEVKRSPLGTTVSVEAFKPGLVIGRKGKNIQNLTDAIKEKFKVENPQLEVKEVEVPEYNASIMADLFAKTLESGMHFRRAAHTLIKQVLHAGALGIQIIISGKITGARARHEKFTKGYVLYCGEPANLYVREAVAHASLKPGIIGVKVRIVPPLKGNLERLGFRKGAAESQQAAEKKAEAVEVQ